jgi:hypothetical protein
MCLSNRFGEGMRRESEEENVFGVLRAKTQKQENAQ